MFMKEKQYLGDGAFAEFDGNGIIVSTEDGERTTNRVYLEPDIAHNFLRYFASISPEALQMMREVVAQETALSEIREAAQSTEVEA